MLNRTANNFQRRAISCKKKKRKLFSISSLVSRRTCRRTNNRKSNRKSNRKACRARWGGRIFLSPEACFSYIIISEEFISNKICIHDTNARSLSRTRCLPCQPTSIMTNMTIMAILTPRRRGGRERGFLFPEAFFYLETCVLPLSPR